MNTTHPNINKFDIIGDIYGCADELKALLVKLGYEESSGYYSHPEGNKAIFLGNFIDRGPKIKKTLHIVKAMCDHGTAEAVLGNHEYNALCFWEINKTKGGYLKKHSIKNILQHTKTLKQFEDDEEEWEHYLLWFMTLPLFIDKGEFRVVHACWDQKTIDAIKNELPDNRLTKTFLHRSVEKNYKEYKSIRTLLKGYEMKLPKSYLMKEGHKHKKAESKIKWWVNPKEATYGNYLINPPQSLKDEIVEQEFVPTHDYYNDVVPLFIGHYFLNSIPKLQNTKVACLDYGVEKEGALVAYRWNGEAELNPKNLISVNHIEKEKKEPEVSI